jgi:hypothetical protein
MPVLTALNSLCFLPQHWIPHASSHSIGFPMLPPTALNSLCFLPLYWIPYASSHCIGLPMLPSTALDSLCVFPKQWIPYASDHIIGFQSGLCDDNKYVSGVFYCNTWSIMHQIAQQNGTIWDQGRLVCPQKSNKFARTDTSPTTGIPWSSQ